MYIATIDTGTTNTRVSIWNGEQYIAVSKQPVGVKDTSIDGNNKRLKEAIRHALEESLSSAQITETDLNIILASGMITSNLGVYEVPHITVPASINEIAKKVVSVKIPEISELLPINFIPGIKNKDSQIDVDNCELMDIMRGEETETFGLIDKLKINGPALFILPGSHNKFVYVNEQNQIAGSITTMSGEILDLVTHNSILAQSVSKSFINEFEQKWFIDGVESAKKVGFNRASFLVRILNLYTDATVNQRANYLLGAVLEADLAAIQGSDVFKLDSHCKVVICGNAGISNAFSHLFKTYKVFTGEIINASSIAAENLSSNGAIAIAKIGGLL